MTSFITLEKEFQIRIEKNTVRILINKFPFKTGELRIRGVVFTVDPFYILFFHKPCKFEKHWRTFYSTFTIYSKYKAMEGRSLHIIFSDCMICLVFKKNCFHFHSFHHFKILLNVSFKSFSMSIHIIRNKFLFYADT